MIYSFLALFIPFIIAIFVFWLWTLIDCAKRNFTNEYEKVIWLVVIFFTHIIGSIVYYFVIQAPNNQGVTKPKDEVKIIK